MVNPTTNGMRDVEIAPVSAEVPMVVVASAGVGAAGVGATVAAPTGTPCVAVSWCEHDTTHIHEISADTAIIEVRTRYILGFAVSNIRFTVAGASLTPITSSVTRSSPLRIINSGPTAYAWSPMPGYA